MTQYDPEFEKYWEKKLQQGEWDMFKPFAAMVWNDLQQAAKEPQQPEVKQLELDGGGFSITPTGVIFESSSEKAWREFGRERKTREQAEAAADKMRKRDRLHAFATEFMGKEYEFKAGEENYITGFSHNQNKWVFDAWNEEEIVGAIYMTEECAEYLCAALNDGRLVL
jgi:hypothetical protein